ncbi:MipA/OmpV family protein [Colwellia psychrerythraea]|uniref:MltA-interacting MipA family protein n=1 Tax=Colwellia psychrerythraea TaxID=28229 RepID=A0A099L254_COLPS|nr:MipA/OmpV family protein [Colwellia psychrerythraea]KGJ96941.1 MltA-interacting MipA family protein [Colwellia psychrerythraea]
MKNIIKTAVVSLVASSVMLTSFTASANEKSEEKKVITTEQVDTKSSDSNQEQNAKNQVADNSENSVTSAVKEDNQAVAKEAMQETSKDTVADKESHDGDDSSFCFGDCDDEKHQSHSCDDDDDDCETIHRFFENRRDGFYVDVSAISSVGDDYAYAANVDTESEFDVAISYRVQLLGLFMESPGISTRRIQGMYSMPAWGVNFYNSEDYSFDLFYQYSTRGIEGLEGIQTRNEDERAGLRMTGFYENSQLQMIYSPVSRNGEGSDGIEASISYSYNLQYRNTNFYTNLGVQYRSKEVTPYGVQTWVEDDLSTSAGISYSAELGVEYPLTTDWVIGSYVGYNALSDRSIAARQDTVEDGYRAGLLLTFVF